MENLKLINTDITTNKDNYIKNYLDYIDVSDNTQKEYAIGLKMFFEYCSLNNINNVQRKDIINYREYLKEQGKSANTINLYLV